MAKYGKRNEVKIDPLSYNMMLIGESGAGKTTLIKEYCERVAGPDSYLFLEMGKEDGADAIQGIVWEPIEDWAKFVEVTDDIIENRFTDYKDLRVVVIDTYDELMALAEPQVVKLHNRENPEKKITSFKSAFGGFNGPTDKAIEIVFDRLWELKKVGVSFITIGHTKRSTIVDPVSNASYSMLTTNMDKRYFEAMKTKVHFLPVIYVDREIAQMKSGRKNIVNGKEEIFGKVKTESRVICFRDDTFSVDSKCRFAGITDEKIPLNVDAFISAITDAIKKERDKSPIPYAEAAAQQAKQSKAAESAQAERIVQFKKEKEVAELEPHRLEYIEKIQSGFLSAAPDIKAKAKAMKDETGYAKFSDPNMPIATLKAISELF